MSKFKIVMLSISGLIGIIALAFVMELGGLQWKRFFAPKHENVRREVFKETRSYNEGKTQDLARYRLEYMSAKTIEDKEAVASTIRIMFADYEAEDLPAELKTFLKQIRGY